MGTQSFDEFDKEFSDKNPSRNKKVESLKNEIIFNLKLGELRNHVKIDAKTISKSTGMSLSTIAKIEKNASDFPLTSIKTYLDSLGCHSDLEITLPNEEIIRLNL